MLKACVSQRAKSRAWVAGSAPRGGHVELGHGAVSARFNHRVQRQRLGQDSRRHGTAFGLEARDDAVSITVAQATRTGAARQGHHT